jgi:CBS-domain-containing membrane protein
VGVLSSADFVGREHEESQVSSTLSACDQSVSREATRPWQIEDVFQDRVSAHMSPAVQTIGAQMPLVEAGRVLCAQHIHRLPVLDEQGSPVGMVTSLDIVAAFVQAVEEARGDSQRKM